MSGGTLAKMTLMHWCETVLFLMWVGMFFVWDNPVSWVVALGRDGRDVFLSRS